ncbi:very short patch repair endonuclease [Haliea sp.]|jgi:DNA mismatch endonuclease (patch repair protein)|uniref:very short patch repair endonuclease n=1 Tax=Haliea sp. TaxID=1932666 RepID=UPI000C3FB3AD|nr:very short patch repair endonuclease [Haliea sp.]MAY92210.1 very short patch repair endonuclease [Haliea sp.]MBK42134.1 very short patch repair endonuclease [Haliea sp.]MBP69806.1 very short patch repair endonuclease [Haliea sp.]
MADTVSPQKRSEIMRSVKQKGTKPEMVVRRMVHRLGYRYRLHRKGLPGSPDLVFSSRRKVIFVHGCFWHQHEGCKASMPPKSNREYWLPKLERNSDRDKRQRQELESMGWTVMTIWECETKDLTCLKSRLVEFLGR